ncbi:halocyanin domain-containing protein [Halobacteriaceae archaeon GCM10025711]
MKRRDFIKAASGATTAAAVGTAATGTAAAQGEPDYGGWLDDVGNYSSTTDARGESEVTITVGAEGNGGNLAFDPPAVWVDPGTTITWEWNGKGGAHNVVAEDGGDFESDLTAESGFTFEQTLEEDGIVTYYCMPHQSLGMKGAIAVGDVETSGGGGGGGGGGEGGGGGGGGEVDPHEMGVPFQPHFVGLATFLMMFVSLVFTFFLLKYGESPNASSPNRK